MADTDTVKWLLLDTDLTTQIGGDLPVLSSSLYLEFNEPGSGEIKIPLDSIAAGNITTGMFLKCEYRGGVRGGFFVDNLRYADADASEGGGRILSVSGRGALALLEKDIIYDDGLTDSTRTFTNMTKAAILIQLIDEAKARGGLSTLTYDFDATDDSAANAWTDSESYNLTIGQNLLEVVRGFNKTGGFDVSIQLVNGEFVLSAYGQGIGTDLSDTIFFRTGANCEEVARESRAGKELVNELLVKYRQGLFTVSDSASIAAYGRNVEYLNIEQAQSIESATTYASAKLAIDKDPKASKTVKVWDGLSPNVFLDYDIGDTVTLDRFGTTSTDRILGLQLDFSGETYAHIVIDFNYIFYDNDLKLQQGLDYLLDRWNTARDGNLLETIYWNQLGNFPPSIGGAPAYYYEIKDLAIDNDILYIAMFLYNYNNSGFNCVFQYNIQTGTFSNVGSTAYPCSAYCMTVMGGDLYVVGANNNNSDTTHRVYKWDGSSWTVIGTAGAPDFINAITNDGTNIYIGSDKFGSTINGVSMTSGVAYYDGSWHSLGSATSGGLVLSLLYHGGDLYAGFDDGVRKYSSGWGTVKGGGEVWDMKSLGNQIILAVKDSPHSYVYTWDGSGTPVEIGDFTGGDGIFTYYRVNKLAINLNDIYAAGDFLTVNGAAGYTNLARYSGGTWYPVDQGAGITGEFLDAVAYTDGYLFVGGLFSIVNENIPANGLAVRVTSFQNAIKLASNSSNFDLGNAIHTAIPDAITNDGEIPFWDAVSQQLRKITWSNIKATIKTYFDTLYLSFRTISVSGQSDVVADGTADTLTLVAGTGMIITTNATSDTITFESSGGGADWLQNDSGATDYIANRPLQYKSPVSYVYAGAPNSPTYDNGVSGIGATLTATINGGIGATSGGNGNRVLVTGQGGGGVSNGIYVVTDEGSLSTPYVLTRATDADETVELNDAVVIAKNGATPGLYLQSTINPVVGTDNIAFAAVRALPQGTAGGELSSTYPSPSLLNSAVIGKVLTGFSAGAGTVSATDTILQAINKIVGNIAAIVSDYLTSASISDNAYDATTWNGDTTHAASKNAIRDKIESMTGITDGDKGDITVSGSGSTWTIDNDAVTYAKMQNVSATDKVLGRSTAGSGDVEEITMTAAGRALVDDASATAQLATLGATPKTGWIEVSDSWSYASASTITIPSDGTTTYEKGMKLRWKQGGGYKYGHIASLTATVITIIVNTDYTVANSAITDIAYSLDEKPFGFPAELNWSPTHSRSGTNYTNAPTTNTAAYKCTGTKISWREQHTMHATPGGTGYQKFTLPVTPASRSTGNGMNLNNAYGLVNFMEISEGARLFKYDGTSEAVASNIYFANGEYEF